MRCKKFIFRFLFTSVLGIALASGVLAQDGISIDPGTPVTADPIKSTSVNNGIQMVRQFGSVPLNMKIGPITSDYEFEFFKQETDGLVFLEGSSHNIRAAYNYTSGNGKNEILIGFTEKIMSVDQMNKTAFNHIFSLKGRRYFLQNDDFSISSGLGTDWVIFSREIVKTAFTPDFKEMNRSGVNFGLDIIARKSIYSQKIVGGVIIQESLANKSSMLDLGFAALWGMPLLKRFAVNADVLYRRTILGAVKSYVYEGAGPDPVDKGYQKIDYDLPGMAKPHSLNLGLSGTFLLSDKFGLNAGYRAQLLIKDYYSHTMFIGGRFAF